jgi:hypothetical protein
VGGHIGLHLAALQRVVRKIEHLEFDHEGWGFGEYSSDCTFLLRRQVMKLLDEEQPLYPPKQISEVGRQGRRGGGGGGGGGGGKGG